jgi:hypothetical protein
MKSLGIERKIKESAGCLWENKQKGYGMFNEGLNPAQPAQQELFIL